MVGKHAQGVTEGRHRGFERRLSDVDRFHSAVEFEQTDVAEARRQQHVGRIPGEPAPAQPVLNNVERRDHDPGHPGPLLRTRKQLADGGVDANAAPKCPRQRRVASSGWPALPMMSALRLMAITMRAPMARHTETGAELTRAPSTSHSPPMKLPPPIFEIEIAENAHLV